MKDEERPALPRIAGRLLLGGLAGLAAALLLSTAAYLIFFQDPHPELTLGRLSWKAAWPVLWTLSILLGAEVGGATLPFAEEGRKLLIQSLLHLAATLLTAAAMGAVLWSWGGAAVFAVYTALVYALVWLGRWVSWWTEAEQLRRALGLGPGPSPLKWRESLPHMGFAFLLCAVTPLALRLLDPPDVPVLSGLLAVPLLPPGAFVPGVSLGKRQGFCPLYPLSCGLFSLAVAPLAAIPFWVYPAAALVPALLGNLLGSRLGIKKRKRPD